LPQIGVGDAPSPHDRTLCSGRDRCGWRGGRGGGGRRANSTLDVVTPWVPVTAALRVQQSAAVLALRALVVPRRHALSEVAVVARVERPEDGGGHLIGGCAVHAEALQQLLHLGRLRCRDVALFQPGQAQPGPLRLSAPRRDVTQAALHEGIPVRSAACTTGWDATACARIQMDVVQHDPAAVQAVLAAAAPGRLQRRNVEAVHQKFVIPHAEAGVRVYVALSTRRVDVVQDFGPRGWSVYVSYRLPDIVAIEPPVAGSLTTSQADNSWQPVRNMKHCSRHAMLSASVHTSRQH
jgi:hypothetical protein